MLIIKKILKPCRGYQFGLIGHYNLQDDLVNGKHYWVKDNYAYGIWYTNINTVKYLFLHKYF